MIQEIAENYEQIRDERVPKIREKVRKEFDLNNVSLAIYDYFQELIDERNSKYKISKSIEDVFKDAV